MALIAAERLLLQAHEDERHAQNIRFAAMSLLLVTVVSLAGVAIAIFESARFGVVIAAIALFIVGAPASLYVLHFAREVGARADTVSKQVAIDLSGMVREVFLDVAKRERWSDMRTESVRLRLSAFPLGQREFTRHDIRPVGKTGGHD